MPTNEEVYKELKQVYDPEIPVNIVDLGLVYDVKVDGHGRLQHHDDADLAGLPRGADDPRSREAPREIDPGHQGHRGADRMGPAWTPQRISAEGRSILGIESDEAS
jgi:hypothetical protein